MRLRFHATPLLLMAALTLVWTWPLALRPLAHVPGNPGDNFSFLWNLWWMRRVLAAGDLAFFHSGYLFHPFGVDVVNHPHTALQGALAATVLAPFSIIAAGNLLVLAAVLGNAVAAYALAIDLTGHRRAAILAGVAFGGSPYIGAHLLGHFDLLQAWVLPLFALLLRRALRSGSVTAAAGCGLTAAAAAYSAYYYVVYIGLLGVTYVAAWSRCIACGCRPRPQTRGTAGARRVLLGALAIDGAVAAWIAVTGGGAFPMFGTTVSARTVQPPLTIAWVLMLLGALTWWRWPLRLAPSSGEPLRRALRVFGIAAVVFLVCAAPLIYQAGSLVAEGRYASQRYFWRSAPRGVDLLAGALGNPFHPLTGSAVGRLYGAIGADRIEGVAWLGVLPLLLLIVPRDRWADRHEAGTWLAVFGVCALWALGPRAMVAGFDVGLPLPQSLVRFLPVVSDARMPGRAMVVVYLALAMLLALRVPALGGRWKAARWQWAVVAAVALDYLSAPVPLTPLDRPSVYERLAALDDGAAVCELPLGIGDGLSRGVGNQDRRILYYATVHGHPLVGGFIGRMPPGAADRYAAMPVVGNLLRLSAGQPAAADGGTLEPLVFRYLVVDTAAMSPELLAYVRSVLDLELLGAGAGRELYAVRRKDGSPGSVVR